MSTGATQIAANVAALYPLRSRGAAVALKSWMNPSNPTSRAPMVRAPWGPPGSSVSTTTRDRLFMMGSKHKSGRPDDRAAGPLRCPGEGQDLLHGSIGLVALQERGP